MIHGAHAFKRHKFAKMEQESENFGQDASGCICVEHGKTDVNVNFGAP
jgi:hypothetical protein